MEQFYQESGPTLPPDNVYWPDPKQVGPFTMVDQQNREFGLDNLTGKWSFVFFGYTSCPDVCPITMSVLKQVNEGLKAAGIDQDSQVIFVSVDPERDTISKLNDYVNYFNPEFIGLGGSIDQLDSLSSQIGIAYIYGLPDEDGHYLVDHTSSIFLLDPDARLVSILSPPHRSEEIVSRFVEITEFINSQRM